MLLIFQENFQELREIAGPKAGDYDIFHFLEQRLLRLDRELNNLFVSGASFSALVEWATLNELTICLAQHKDYGAVIYIGFYKYKLHFRNAIWYIKPTASLQFALKKYSKFHLKSQFFKKNTFRIKCKAIYRAPKEEPDEWRIYLQRNKS